MSKCEQCIVREFSSLKTLTKDELISMSNCKTASSIKKGEALFLEGDNVNGVYCIKEGVCKMTKLSANGKDQIVKLTQKGELLGQRSLISDEPANLSAIAVEDMQVCFIPKSEILNFFNTNNNFSMSLMKSICGDLKDADDTLVNLAQKNVKERLAQTLLYFEKNFGVSNDNSLKLQLSREEIASIIGTATESCIRLLSEFKKLGLIELQGKKITILDKAKLKRLIE
ncbi:Crp/Fnr family transcriptional regulator [Flavobacterium sp.]|uniref:Crp/Fnr family transcriptional regulator n=1 Tax=Flavobacterium sp. TaxID=239 RepID=UPI00261A546E|nr:Crp/Fnr family transcriptional regulator [Flavobacterium sp.]MDD3003829.1 Crp/Fnr family transcriptional regulator [Flavobacterium sp.]